MGSKFVFLGTGSSMGVPVIGCHCSTCKSQNPRNKRKRSSSLLEVQGKTFLVDAGPDFREQALSHKIERIDGFILTHAHYDHIGGFDDVKLLKQKETKIPCLMLKETFSELQEKYSYFIRPTEEDPLNSTFFSWQILEDSFGSFDFQEASFKYVTFFQGRMKILGLRVNNFAYISDIKQFDESIFLHLKGIEILVISALRPLESPMHFSIEDALHFADKVGAQKVYFTHIAHEVDHDLVQADLPSHVVLAYDGLSISF